METINVTRQAFPAPDGGRAATVRRRRLWEVHADCHCPVIGIYADAGAASSGRQAPDRAGDGERLRPACTRGTGSGAA
ncbi:MAG: hypothetical protein IPO35_07150 [Uliginosibacterium sp.]|nr:hypothetical protein [Uliginosibacterium sp.]